MSAQRLDGNAGLTGVVSRFLLDVARHSTALPTGQSERVLAHASDLVITLLSSGLRDTDAVRGAVQRSLILRIKDYINQRLWDSTLGPVEVAAAVNISTRYLHSSSRWNTTPCRCTSEHAGSNWHDAHSWTRASPIARSLRSPTPAGSATSAASTVPSREPWRDPDRATQRDTQQVTSAAIATIPPYGQATASGPPCMTWKASRV
jgi:hypothetical protein